MPKGTGAKPEGTEHLGRQQSRHHYDATGVTAFEMESLAGLHGFYNREYTSRRVDMIGALQADFMEGLGAKLRPRKNVRTPKPNKSIRKVEPQREQLPSRAMPIPPGKHT